MNTQKFENKEQKNEFSLPAYQVVFLRKLLSQEKLNKEDAEIRNHFTVDTLLPVLKEIDIKIAEIRDKYAVRLNNGQIKTDVETGIDYGANTNKATKEFEDLMSSNINIPIKNRAELFHIFGIFFNTNTLLNEEETVIFNDVVEALKKI